MLTEIACNPANPEEERIGKITGSASDKLIPIEDNKETAEQLLRHHRRIS